MISSTSQIPFKRAFIINQLLINNDTYFLEYLLVGSKGDVVTAYTFVFFNKVQHGIIYIKQDAVGAFTWASLC